MGDEAPVSEARGRSDRRRVRRVAR
jgi:hypothetical protein